MKPEVTAAEPIQSITARPSCRTAGGLGPQTEPCPAAEDDESAVRHLFELSRDVILSLDREGNILCINPRGVQLSGYSETQLRGANIFERLLLPEDWRAARQMLDDLVSGKAREYEIRWKTSDGAILQFDGASVPRRSSSGEFLSTLCTLRDVTERKCAEEKLRDRSRGSFLVRDTRWIFPGDPSRYQRAQEGGGVVYRRKAPFRDDRDRRSAQGDSECLVFDYRGVPSRHACFRFVASSWWCS